MHLFLLRTHAFFTLIVYAFILHSFLAIMLLLLIFIKFFCS